METVVKRYFNNFAFKITATALLINLIVSTETPADSDAAVESETNSVTVTRTGEGIEVVTPDGRHVLLRDDHTWAYLEPEQLPPPNGRSRSACFSVIVDKRGPVKALRRLLQRYSYPHALRFAGLVPEHYLCLVSPIRNRCRVA